MNKPAWPKDAPCRVEYHRSSGQHWWYVHNSGAQGFADSKRDARAQAGKAQARCVRDFLHTGFLR